MASYAHVTRDGALPPADQQVTSAMMGCRLQRHGEAEPLDQRPGVGIAAGPLHLLGRRSERIVAARRLGKQEFAHVASAGGRSGTVFVYTAYIKSPDLRLPADICALRRPFISRRIALSTSRDISADLLGPIPTTCLTACPRGTLARLTEPSWRRFSVFRNRSVPSGPGSWWAAPVKRHRELTPLRH